MTIQIPLRFPLLLHQKERWEAQAGTGLPENKCHNDT